MKKVKLLVFVFIIFLGLGEIIFLRFGLSVESLVYWWVLLLGVWLIWTFRLDARFPLLIALALLVLSALMVSIGLREIGETVLRLSLLGWLIGLVQSALEYINARSRIETR